MMKFNDCVYGEVVIDDPCAEAIIASPAFDRLWRINQQGPFGLAESQWKTSRADHCIGAYRLLQILGASREEQLAGLVHDANHLAFSHLVDWLMDDSATQEGHTAFVAHNPHLDELRNIFNTHGLDGAAIMDYERYSLLEQPSPAMCADRVDYTLRDGVVAKQLTRENCARIVASLTAHNGVMAFTDPDVAALLAHVSVVLHIVREGLWGNGLYAGFGAMLKAAMEKSALSPEDFLVDDDHVMAIVREQKDKQTVRTLEWISGGAPIETSAAEDADYHTKAKVRFIDPHVLVGKTLAPVSVLQPGLARYLRDYALLRQNTLHIRLPQSFRDIAPSV